MFFVLRLSAHAIAYGDPSGGMLFQVLTPLAAVLWGGWLIFAGGVRKRLGKLFRKFRSDTPDGEAELLDRAPDAD